VTHAPRLVRLLKLPMFWTRVDNHSPAALISFLSSTRYLPTRLFPHALSTGSPLTPSRIPHSSAIVSGPGHTSAFQALNLRSTAFFRSSSPKYNTRAYSIHELRLPPENISSMYRENLSLETEKNQGRMSSYLTMELMAPLYHIP
jgi:hypothetical protein